VNTQFFSYLSYVFLPAKWRARNLVNLYILQKHNVLSGISYVFTIPALYACGCFFYQTRRGAA
jgi:hypothetical protein